VWSELRAFGDERAIPVHKPPSVCFRARRARGEQLETVCVAPFLIGVREVATEITESGRAKDRVAQRMRNEIGITVSYKGAFPIKGDPTENKWAQRGLIGGKAVDVHS